MVSSRIGRLKQMANEGSRGARAAIMLADDPGRFLPTVQIGITLIGVLAGAFSGATLAQKIERWLIDVPVLGQFASGLAIAIVVIGITYLSLIFGELVPKRIALTDAERVAALVARAVGAAVQADRAAGLVSSPLQRCGAADARAADDAASHDHRRGGEGSRHRRCRGGRFRARRTRHDRWGDAARRSAGSLHHDAARRRRLARPGGQRGRDPQIDHRKRAVALSGRPRRDRRRRGRRPCQGPARPHAGRPTVRSGGVRPPAAVRSRRHAGAEAARTVPQLHPAHSAGRR